MGIYNKYPYTDFHEMNLDWIIKMIHEMETSLNEFEALNKITFAGPWNITSQYPQWAIVENDGSGYLSLKAVPAGIRLTDPEYWLHVSTYMSIIADMQNAIDSISDSVDNLTSDTTSALTAMQNQIDSISVNAGALQIESQNAVIAVTDGTATNEFTIPLHAKILDVQVRRSGLWTNTDVGYDQTTGTDDITVTVTAVNLTSANATLRILYSFDGTVNLPELTNIRIGYDGTVYSAAGAAVRSQIESLHESLDYITGGGILSLNWESGGISYDTGSFVDNDAYLRCGPFDLSAINSIRIFNNTDAEYVAGIFVWTSGEFAGRVLNKTIAVGTNQNFALSEYDGYFWISIHQTGTPAITSADAAGITCRYITGLSGAVKYSRALTSSDTFSSVSDNGIYAVSNAVAAAINDSPSDYGGNLLILKAGDTLTPIQIYLTNDSDPNIYIRYGIAGEWSAMAKNSSDINNAWVSAGADYFVSDCIGYLDTSGISDMFIFGDSIATESHGGFTWPSIVAEKTGWTEHNFAEGGYAFVHYNYDTMRIINQINDVTDWTACDIVFVAGGTNDAAYNTGAAALRTAVQNVITAIRSHTTAPIIFITPIQRGDSLNTKLPTISGAICNVAVSNGCGVINGFSIPIATYSDSWITELTDGDGLHPNATGKRVYAQAILSKLR